MELIEKAHFYNCFGHVDKIRILNLFKDKATILTVADIEQVLKIGRGTLYKHLKSIETSDILNTITHGSRFVFYYSQLPELISSMLSEVNDIQLMKDELNFKYLYEGGFLRSSKFILNHNKGKMFIIKKPKNWNRLTFVTSHDPQLLVQDRKGRKYGLLGDLEHGIKTKSQTRIKKARNAIEKLNKKGLLMWDEKTSKMYEDLKNQSEKIIKLPSSH